jgi:hypothetical protein
MFLVFATIPKAFGFEAATHFQSILLRGSLIPIVVIGMGMAFSRQHILAKSGMYLKSLRS